MDYEKRYKDALRRAKKLYGQGTITECLGWVFPELEDEDTRIKREILELVSIAGNGNQFEEIKDWLEKQVERTHDTAVNDRIWSAISHGLTDVAEDAGWSDFGGLPIEEIQEWLEKQGHMLHPDRVIEWLECEAFQGWAEPIDIRPIIRKFKKDFGL